MKNQDNAIGLHDHPINALDDVQKTVSDKIEMNFKSFYFKAS